LNGLVPRSRIGQGELWVAVGRPAVALAPALSSHATRWRCTAHARAKVPWSTTSTSILTRRRPDDEEEAPATRALSIEAVFAFPELADDGADASGSVPEFFAQMTADDDGQLKLRIHCP
jgi:hypothetical protein